MTALCWLLLMAAGSLPTGRIFILTLASFLVASACQELSLAGAGLVYLASALLALLWPGLLTALLFGLCFGLLPLVFYFLRRRFKPWLTRLLTHLFMTGLFFLVIHLVGLDRLLSRDIPTSNLAVEALALLVLQLFLVVYYYALQHFEVFYSQRIAPWFRRKS